MPSSLVSLSVGAFRSFSDSLNFPVAGHGSASSGSSGLMTICRSGE